MDYSSSPYSQTLSDSRVLVLGAGGFIGTNLCRALQGRVKRLRAFGRRQAYPEALNGIEWLQGDFSDPSRLAIAVSDVDVVYHLVTASTPASSNVDKLADLHQNVFSTLHLLEACKAASVRKVVFISSGGTVYGLPRVLPTPEWAPTDPIAAYGITKLVVEKYLHLYQYLHGIDYAVLRVSNPFGPFQSAEKNQGVIAAFLRNAILGIPLEIWGDGRVERDYIYIDDVVDALIRVGGLGTGEERIFNIGSGSSRSLIGIVESVEQLLGKPVDSRLGPSRPVDVPRTLLDISLAKEKLGWTPQVQFEVGLTRTCDWITENLIQVGG
ncbi:MAG: NAD-dependent epimerase/dehydratase family protein [Bdellovibrionales bacterium]|nr:NAD-dependent epimerase/dehydratase family protein [Bdellovibrionales bacterium]